jgi:hypothetical protein
MDLEVECTVCKKRILRNRSEVNRNAKLGRRVYCSRNCCGKDNVGNIPEENRRGDISKLRADNRADEYSMFRVFMHRINLRVRERRHKASDLTLQDLKEQWEKQDGVCPYTGWKMLSPKNSNVGRPRSPAMASLDRIDSSKGYVKGNVEFVCFMAQCAKHTFRKKDVLDFCSAVTRLEVW